MAKKQQIILTHGYGVPTFDKNVVKQGEVLVRHAEDAKEAALYTPNYEENAFLEFPSKAWVSNEITQVNTAAGELNETVTALQTQVDGIDAAYKKADAAMDAAYKAADTKIREDFAAADSALKTELEGADAALEAQIGTLDTRVTANEGAIADLQAADTAMETAYKAADDVVRGEFAAADDVVRGEFAAADTALDTKFAGLVSGLDTRVEANEGAIADLQAADTAMETAYKAADDVVRGEFADADALLSAEIAKKANSTDLSALADRVGDIEGEDANKSMREVAAEEAAKEVAKVVAEAPENFDTLKEVADWIASDTQGSAALQTDVAKLKEVTEGYEGKGVIKAAVDTIEGRVTANEGAITNLQGEDAKIRTDFADADDVVRGEFADADALLSAEIAKKANNDTVTTLSGRVDVIQDAYVKQVNVTLADGTVKTFTPVNNILDLSEMIIDGGTY